ncbi:mutator type transposase [Tanacetum coccineum]
MLCEWRIRKKGSKADPYVDYGAFPTVFCLKINHGGAFTPPPKIRYKGGKVNWVDTIDSDVFSVVEVNNMMKELGYEKPSFDYYYKEPKNDLDNGLKKLSSDQDVLQMLKYVEKYKVIDLYVDHSVTKETVNVDESLLVNELDNDLFIGNEMLGDNDEDVIEDVSEDEWLQKSLRLVGIKKKHAVENDNVRGQSSRNESMNVEDDRDDGSNSDDGSASDDDSDSQDSDFLVDPDNMIDDVDVDMAEFRSNIDANVEWVGSKAILTMEEEEFEEEEVNLDELNSGSDSEYEGERKKALKMYHKMNKDASNAESSGTTWKENFYVGLKFSNSKQIKEMVTRVAVEQRRELHLKKNDKVRVRCICRGKVPQFGCEDGDDDSGSKGVVSSGSKGKGQSKEKGQVSGSKGKSNNKTKAGGGPLKDGFKAGKRDLLRLDGCFLSGSYPGWILTAVGVDLNNGIYPLAYAIVESENKDLWKWFLECVGDDLDLFRNSNFTFISDRQKGIIPAIAESFPSAEHRFCLKHIYDNMKLSWRGQLYKEMLWRCATSTTVQRFDKHMEKLKDFNKDAYEWLKKIPPQHWSRSHFSGRAHCDVLLNNMCEVFNRQLINGRDKPIITCLEFIREYLMKRIVNVQKVISKSDGPLTPNATKVFNKIVKEAGQMKIDWNGGNLYQATSPWGDQCVVNMRTKECSCRKWELTRIPCKHALAAIWDMAGNGEETAIPGSYCHQVHWLSTWKDMPPKKRKKSAAELAEGMVKGNKLSKAGKSITCGKCKGIGHNQRKCPNDASAQTATQTQQSSQAPPATQATHASQTGHTTPFHPSQLHASPTKMTKASDARRSST